MTKDSISHWVINLLQKVSIISLFDKKGYWSFYKMEEKIEGRKVQYLSLLLSRNMRKYTSKNTGFCPNKVIHSRHLFTTIFIILY